jgi:CubicO group peptidase (beta-lactamase class C family)
MEYQARRPDFGLSRRHFVKAAGASLGALTWPASPAWADASAWHDRTTANHRDEYAKATRAGLGLASLSVYGDAHDPRFAAILTPLPHGVVEAQVIGVNARDWPRRVDEMAKRGLSPGIVTATGPAQDPFIAAVFRTRQEGQTEAAIGLDAQALAKRNEVASKTGDTILTWLDCYGDAKNVRFAGVWSPDPLHECWGCGPIDETADALNARMVALGAIGVRASHIAVTPSGRNIALLVDRGGDGATWRTNMTSAQYQAEYTTQTSAGYTPIRVSAKGSGAQTRFAAIFASSRPRDERVFRANGPVTVPEIDAGIEAYMKATGLHGIGLAVVDRTRLVYAKGYTWAGRDYPDVQPTTLFRQASVSKTFVALALYQIMQEQPEITLDTTMQSVLKLKTPDGKPPVDARFATITLRQLIESTSGLNNNRLWGSLDAAAAAKKPLPADVSDLERLVAATPLVWQPGDPKHVIYSNVGYFMAGRVVAKLRNKHLFIDALAPTLAKLQMTRTRSSRSLFAAQARDEARYHVNDLPTSPDVRSSARPVVPSQYGGLDSEILEGAGGLSAAAIDVARIAAMLSAREASPILRPETRDTWLEHAALATKSLTGPHAHGYHGFDYASKLRNGEFSGAKGGSLGGTGTAVIFDTQKFSYAYASNGNARDAKPDWLRRTIPIAEKHDWGTTDLFAHFGMAPFPVT